MKATLKFAYKCKNSVRFNILPTEDRNKVISIYLMNEAYKELGEPKEITITITKVLKYSCKKHLHS